MINTLVSKNSSYESVKQQPKSSGSGVEPHGLPFRGVVCYYCCKLRHTRRKCRKLLNLNQRFQSAHVASACNASKQSIVLSTDEYAKFLKFASTSTLVELGKPNLCLMSSSSN